MHYFLEIPCKNDLFVDEIGHGVQLWRTVCNFAIINTSRSVNASVFRLSSAHSRYTLLSGSLAFLLFPSPWVSTYSTLQPKAGYCPEVKIVPRVGVLPKVKTLVSLLSLPFFGLFLLTVFLKISISWSFTWLRQKYIIFAPVTLFICFSPTVLPSLSGDKFWAFCFPYPFSRLQ